MPQARATREKDSKTLIAIYKKLKEYEEARDGTSALDVPGLKTLVKEAVREARAASRALTVAELRHRTACDLLRQEIRSEGVDREANSARINERQRVLFERSSAQQGALAAHDFAAASAGYVEAALASLCPDPHTRTDNSGRLQAGLKDRALP